jgi:hypothetical protein
VGKHSLPILAACLFCFSVCEAQTISEAASASRVAWQTGDLPLNAPSSGFVTAPDAVGHKSPWTAVGLSLLLPGTGHVYAGAKGRSRIFFGTEAVLWSMAIFFDRKNAWRGDDAVNYAVSHAQLDPDGKDDTFLENLEFYQNRDEYNTAGRIIDPTRPFLPETDDTYWQWDDPANRTTYRDIRNSAETASRNRTFTFYAALLNRVVASLDAFRIVRSSNARQHEQQGLKISAKPKVSWSNPGIMLNARFTF